MQKSGVDVDHYLLSLSTGKAIARKSGITKHDIRLYPNNGGQSIKSSLAPSLTIQTIHDCGVIHVSTRIMDKALTGIELD